MTELAEPFAMSQPAISKHLKTLERARLITVGQDAQRRPRRFEGKPLAEASAWLDSDIARAGKPTSSASTAFWRSCNVGRPRSTRSRRRTNR